MKKVIFFFLLITVIEKNTFAQIKIDSIVQKIMIENKIVGLSVAMVKNGKIIFTKGYGTAKKNENVRIDSVTNFLTCSISKLFTATAIMRLVQEGKIDISRKLTDYVPEFRMKGRLYKDITIEQMLTHTSGLPNILNRHFIHPKNDSVALTEFAKKLRKKKLSFKPGVQLSAKTYSNTAYDILGLVIERVTHQTFSAYVSKNILQAADMQLSSFFIDSIKSKRRSTPHSQDWLTGKVKPSTYYPNIPQDKPCGNLNSCSLDLCKWMIYNLSICKSEIHGIISNATLCDMWSVHRSIPHYKTAMGLGWWLYDSDKFGRYFFHVGNDPGFSSSLIVSPQNDFGIVVLCNGEYPRQIVWNKIPFEIMKSLNIDWKK